MKSQTELLFLEQLLVETGSWLGVSTHLDFRLIEKRVKDEGLSFLTIGLPKFGKDLERSLELGYVPRDAFRGFNKMRRGGRSLNLPIFLGGFMELIFDPEGGELLSNPSWQAIRAVRQLTLLFGKLKQLCSPKRVELAFASYIRCDEELREVEEMLFNAPEFSLYGQKLLYFERVSNFLWRELFTKIDHQIYVGEVLPKHGSGSTAEKLLGNKKFRQLEWTDRLEAYFSWTEYMYPSYSLALEHEDLVVHRDPAAERPVRVVAVAKTQSTPRIIAIEPTAVQYVQQGILELFVSGVGGHDYARNLLDWSSQIPNQEMAWRGSIANTSDEHRLSTLDLSEASDRVGNRFVQVMLKNHPHLREAIDATRSRTADVNGRIINLVKYASMGSALCFPMESLFFMTIIICGITEGKEHLLTKQFIHDLFGKVRTYGDDIIVPEVYTSSVIEWLETFGLKVNSNKSFRNGKFRESCGKDFYDGRDVTYVKVRTEFPSSRKHVSEIQSVVSLRNLLHKVGYQDTVNWLDSYIERLIPFPYIEPTSRALGRWTDAPINIEHISPTTQTPQVKGAYVIETLPKSFLDGSGALMKFFLRRGVTPFRDVKHLERAGRPISSRIKIGWADIR